MNRVSSCILLCGALFGLASCSSEEGFVHDGPQGKITLDLTADSSVLMNTRADDTKVSVIPESSQFAISLEKQDGSFSQKWANVNLFNKETSFPIGTYTISASYGNMEKEGFELPYFYASQEVTLESGIESHVNLTASLANAMVSVRYTDEFKGHFSAYSASLKAASSADMVIFAQEEDRPAYMKPENISLRLTLTNTQGQKVTVSPYSFVASPQHHYIVTMGVKDDQGTDDVRLDVQITEEVTSEFVDISLGDDLFNAPKPSVKAFDFPASMSYEDFEGFEAPGDPRMDVLAYGGLKKVNLNVSSANTLIFGNSVQLVNADQLTQANIQTTGLVAEGFYRNPDKAGVIKFKDFLSNLPEGTYKISVDVEDARTLTCEPVIFNVAIKKVTIKLGVAKHPEYMGEEMTVSVTANKADVKSKVRFEVTDANEQWQKAPIIADPVAVRKNGATRADEEYTFNYRIAIPAAEHYDVKVRAFYGAETTPKDEIVDEGVIFPEYKVEIDPFAHRALLKVTPTDPSKLDIIMKNLKFVLKGNERALSLYDAENGIFELSGLDANTQYEAFQTFLSYIDNPHQAGVAFKTEPTTDVANGSFAENTLTVDYSNIQVGGQYNVSPANYTLKSSIKRETPEGWATLNDLTCWGGSSNKNSWFMVPSTYSDNGQVVIQSVGYNHNGTTPARSGGAFNTTYYCTNAPSDAQLNKSRGELFLGTYSYDGIEHRTDGISWTTRPESLSFKYSYKPQNNERGEVAVRILDAAGNQVAQGSALISSGDNQTMNVPITGYSFGKKAARIELVFRSTQSGVTPSIHIPTGSELNEHQSLGNHTLDANSYHAFAVGSKLTVDDVSLGYDSQASANAKKRQGKSVKSQIASKTKRK